MHHSEFGPISLNPPTMRAVTGILLLLAFVCVFDAMAFAAESDADDYELLPDMDKKSNMDPGYYFSRLSQAPQRKFNALVGRIITIFLGRQIMRNPHPSNRNYKRRMTNEAGDDGLPLWNFISTG